MTRNWLAVLPFLPSLISCDTDGQDQRDLEGSVTITPLTSSGDAWGHPDWSPDGRWIVYLQGTKDSSLLWIIPAVGGEARQITTSPDDICGAKWGPDSRRLAFISSRGGENLNVWTLSPFEDDGSVSQVSSDADSVSYCSVHWSPDGGEIVFSSTKGSGPVDIWRLPSTGGAPRQVTDGPGRNWDPAWSPDGEWIAFHSTRGGATNLWIVPAAGGTARQLTDHPLNDWQPRWSPDGMWMAFVSTRNSTGHGQLTTWIMPATGGTPMQVGGAIAGHAWSPDGTQIAATALSKKREIWKIPLSAAEPTPLLRDGFQTGSRRLAWSPDMTRVAFVESGPEGEDIWTVSIETGERRQVTTGGAFGIQHHPWYDDMAWSPDSERIAFNGLGPDGADLWVIPAVGGTAERVTITPGFEYAIAWSPDGETLAFSAEEDEHDDECDIWTVPAVGGEAEPLVAWPGVEGVPVFSPDGEMIAFTARKKDGPFGIWIMPVDGGEATFLTQGVFPRGWSVDGTELFFWNDSKIWKVPVPAGQPQLLLEGIDIYHAWSPDGSHVLSARTRSDVVIADVEGLLR